MLNSDIDSLTTASPATLTDKNYFAYCDNNPVTRADDEGSIWHIVAGAVVGAVLNSVQSTIDLVDSYKNGGDTKKAWLHLGVSVTTGAISGGLSMTSMCATASIATNAATSLIEESLNQAIDKEFNLTQLAIAGIEGAISGRKGGDGTVKATQAGLDTIKRTANTFSRVKAKKGTLAAVKAYKGRCAQQAAKYLKQTKNITKEFKRNTKIDIAVTVIKTLWTNKKNSILNFINKIWKK